MKSHRSKASPGVPATDMPVEIPASSLAVLTIRIPGGLWQIIRRRGPFRGALNPIIHRHLCHHVPSFHFPLQLWLWNQLSKDGTGYVQPPKQEIKEMSTNWSRSRCLNKENNLWWRRGCSKPSFLNPLNTESHQTWLSSAPLWYFTVQWYKANLINTFWFISRLQSRKTKCTLLSHAPSIPVVSCPSLLGQPVIWISESEILSEQLKSWRHTGQTGICWACTSQPHYFMLFQTQKEDIHQGQNVKVSPFQPASWSLQTFSLHCPFSARLS